MADIALSTVGKVIGVGLAIKDAVEAAEQNKEDCEEIKKHVLTITAVLKGLEENNMMDDDPARRGALEDLEKSLQKALKLVTACNKRHVVCLFCLAKDLSKKLRRVQDEIQRKLILGVFANFIQANIMWRNIGCPPHPQPQNAGASSNDMTEDSRIETDIKDNNVIPAERDTCFASLNGLTKFTWAEIEHATTVFSHENLIGQGGFGKVYKGALQDGQLVAIKIFANSNELSHQEIARELNIISKAGHTNIVKCLGYAHEDVTSFLEMGNQLMPAMETHFCLVHEYMENGDLESINSGSRANWSSRLKLIDGIAQGVNYIHGQRILHMDLKPSNILLDSNMNAKIADFGISKLSTKLQADSRTPSPSHMGTSDLVGTMGYMAPEYIFSGTISFKADVYAFGIIVLGTIMSGMCKGEPPASAAASIEWAWEAREKSHRQLKYLFDPSLFDEFQLKQIKTCFDIGLRCAERDRNKRPKMADVVEELNRIKDAAAGSLKNPSLLRRLNTLTSDGRHK